MMLLALIRTTAERRVMNARKHGSAGGRIRQIGRCPPGASWPCLSGGPVWPAKQVGWSALLRHLTVRLLR
jgi:hypothetical protein